MSRLNNTNKEQVRWGGRGETETDGQRQRQSKSDRERVRTGGRWWRRGKRE